MTTTTIDCQTCPVRGRHCGDCFVPVLGRLWLGAPEPPPTALTDDELAAVAAFVRAGLVHPDEAASARAELTPASGYAVS